MIIDLAGSAFHIERTGNAEKSPLSVLADAQETIRSREWRGRKESPSKERLDRASSAPAWTNWPESFALGDSFVSSRYVYYGGRFRFLPTQLIRTCFKANERERSLVELWSFHASLKIHLFEASGFLLTWPTTSTKRSLPASLPPPLSFRPPWRVARGEGTWGVRTVLYEHRPTDRPTEPSSLSLSLSLLPSWLADSRVVFYERDSLDSSSGFVRPLAGQG